MDFFNRENRVRKLKKKATDDVNFFPNPKWQIVTFFEQYSGLWPYQSKVKQCLLQSLSFLTFLIMLLAVANKSREFLGVDLGMSIECIITLLFLFAVIVKLTLASIYQHQKQQIYEKVANHFKVITDPEEAKVLETCANQGFRFMAIFIIIATVIVGLYDSIPNIILLYHYLFADKELKLTLPIQMNYGVDHRKYWFCIMFHFLVFVYTGIVMDIAVDLSFILQTRHVQALFKIVGLRLNRVSELTDEFENETISEIDAREVYSLISSAINLHSECFEIIDLMKNAYTINWFIILLINTGVFGAGIHLISLRLHDPVETFRNLCVFLLLLMHFYVIFHQGQLIIDSSSTVSYACYDCKWYNLPRKSSKLLHVMMIRASIPSELTGAQFFPLSIESFGKMLKAGISYYTVFQT